MSTKIVRRPLLLDLFCKAGGCSVGYHRAGFDVVGVDIERQPRYPFPFVQMDALECLRILVSGGGIMASDAREYFLRDFAAVHASPPCQVHSALAHFATPGKHQDLIPATRAGLIATGLPYVIENVVGAPLRSPVKLCGTMFGLCTDDGTELERHRIFETNWRLRQVDVIANGYVCRHGKSTLSVTGTGQPVGSSRRRVLSVTGTGSPNRRETVVLPDGRRSRTGRTIYTFADAQKAMGINWMPQFELSQAIPPAYTQFIGEQLRCQL